LGPARDIRLEAGDLLYIPRGHVHEAFTSECASLHLTVGVNVFRWLDLFQEALAALGRDERFRESLPPGSLGGQALPGSLRERFAELLEAVGRGLRLEDGIGRLGDQFFGQMQPLPRSQFTVLPEEEPLELDTILEKSRGAVCRVLQDGQGWVVIEFPGGQVGGPARIAAALNFIAQAQRFPVHALPGLGAEAQRVLAGRLVRAGLLTIAGRPPTGNGRIASEVIHPCGVGK